MIWFLNRGSGIEGPFSEEQIVELIRAGMRSARVHREGAQAWMDIGIYPTFAAALKERRAFDNSRNNKWFAVSGAAVLVAAALWASGVFSDSRSTPLENPIPPVVAAPPSPALLEKAREEKKRQRAVAEQIDQFFQWVAANADAPQKTSDDEKECYGTGDPEAGFCAIGIASSDRLSSVKWLVRNPAAFEFESGGFPDGPELTCAQFGAKLLRRWHWKGAGVLSHCVLRAQTSPRLKAHHLWIKNSEGGLRYLRVFSDEYLKVAPYNFARTLSTQGTTLQEPDPPYGTGTINVDRARLRATFVRLGVRFKENLIPGDIPQLLGTTADTAFSAQIVGAGPNVSRAAVYFVGSPDERRVGRAMRAMETLLVEAGWRTGPDWMWGSLEESSKVTIEHSGMRFVASKGDAGGYPLLSVEVSPAK